jgi:CubicO group peptidase (beta-lactamase class C family)
MQQRVFDRFGMARTSMTWREDFRPNFSRGHGTNGEIILHRTWANAGAAGSMDTTVEDYSKFVVAVLSGEGLSESARAEMLGEQVEITARRQFPTQFPEDTEQNQAIGLSYGLGWGLFDSNFGPAFFKEGHDDGTNNYVLCLQESKRCMVVLSNSSNGEGIFLYLANALLGDTGLPWEWEGYIPYDRE